MTTITTTINTWVTVEGLLESHCSPKVEGVKVDGAVNFCHKSGGLVPAPSERACAGIDIKNMITPTSTWFRV
jgi:hypothetical protein